MHLPTAVALTDLSRQHDETTGRDEEVLRRCRAAKESEAVGNYEDARQALGNSLERVGEPPNLDGLQELASAELLLRVGVLTTRTGRAHQISGAQELAKDLISHSLRIFEKLELSEKVAEAQIDLATCYWREGALDEARVTLHQALERVSDGESEQRLRALISISIVERSAGRYQDALRVQVEAAHLFERSSNEVLRGNFHLEHAIVLKNLGNTEGRQDYRDRAFIEYSAAGYHFELAGNLQYVAIVENNLGFLFLTAGKHIEAHQHLNRARSLFVKLKDKGSIAQVDETRARVFLAQGLYAQAEGTVRGSVRTLEEGDDRAILSEALTTHGEALARLERPERAHAQLKKAIEVAHQAGNLEKAGLAALTVVEVLSSHVSPPGLREYYRNAESFLAESQDPSIDVRLGVCARTILAAQVNSDDSFKTVMTTVMNTDRSLAVDSDSSLLAGAQRQTDHSENEWKGCSLENEVLQFEGELIQRALEASSGSVTRAARMLGVTHQGLAFILNGRHKALLTVRTPVRRRRKSIFRNH